MYKSRSGAYAANNVAANTDITNLLLPATAAKISITAFEIRCSVAARIQVNDKDVIHCAPAKNGLTGYVARVNLNKKFFVGIEKIEILDACDLTLNYFYHIVHASVAAPVFSLPTGAVESGTVLSLNSATLDAAIIYTINGEQAVYTAPITLTETATITAYAIKDGYVSSTSTATYIVNGTVNKVPYNFRQSPAGIGNVMIDKIIGGTIAWNQKVAINPSAVGEVNEITFVKNPDNSIHIYGTATAQVQQTISITFYVYANHKYYISGLGDGGAQKWDTRIGSAAAFQNGKNYTYKKGDILSCIGTIATVFIITVRNGATIDKTFYPQCFDLTLMFGSTIADYVYTLETAIAGSGVAWLKAHGFFTKPYYAYNAGELMSVNTSAHITTDVDITDTSWAGIKKIVSAGLAPRVFPVGYEFTTLDSDTNKTITWVVRDHDHYTAADGDYHTMVLETKYVYSTATGTYKGLVFDAAEALYYCSEALPAGTYNFTWNYATGSMVNGTYQFTLAEGVPAGGQIVIGTNASSSALTSCKIKTYASVGATAAIESNIAVTEGSGGTSLGTVNNTSSSDDNLNCGQRVLFGSNNYAQSGVRQWLNSVEAAGSVYEAQTKFNRPPSWNSSYNGLLHGLPADFLAAVGKVKIPCRTNSVFEVDSLDGTEFTVNQVYELKDKFFLISRPEIYGSYDSTSYKDGTQLEYYEGLTQTELIKRDGGGSARNAWLRSPSPSSADYERGVYTDGSLGNTYAINAYAVAPACCIVGDATVSVNAYPLDDTLTLNGLYKLDADNKLYCDGDIDEGVGTVTRTFEKRAYKAGDESLADAITDGTYTVVKLATPTTETANPYTNPQTSTPNGTEEYVDAGVEAGTRDVAIPVGHETFYS